jgi:glycosyltransferase involved in cell wall biosynthesis
VRLHQLVAAVAPADAVSDQALAWQAALRRRGVAGEIFAEHVHPELAGRVLPLRDFVADGGPVLLRYSIWSAAAERAAEVPRDRLGLLYHNITPAQLLRRANPALADLCDRGRRALPGLARRVSVAIADSSFNAAELSAAGFPAPSVVPLLLPLGGGPPPPAREAPPPVVLTVGRVVPSKRIEDVIRAVAVLRRHLLPDARLEVIGSWEGYEAYRAALGRLAAGLGVGGAVRLAGRVSDAERDRAYREAGVYLAMSEHEGFCAPLLEAMAADVPILAYAAAAVPETLGGSGVQFYPKDMEYAAELLAVLTFDDDVRARVIAGQRARLAHFSDARLQRELASVVAYSGGTYPS